MPFEKGGRSLILARPGDKQYEMSRNRGFRFRSIKADRYEIRDGILQPERSEAPLSWSDYWPLSKTGILDRLANIEIGDESALLRFAKQYGLLGFTAVLPHVVSGIFQGKLITVDELLADPNFCHEKHFGRPITSKERMKRAREHVRQDLASLKDLASKTGLSEMSIWYAWVESGGADPLPWIWAHIRTIQTCVLLTDCIRFRDEERLNAFFLKHQCEWSRRSKDHFSLDLNDMAWRYQIVSFSLSFPSECTVFERAREVRRTLINENIQSIRIELQPEGRTERRYFNAGSLIELLYYQLLESIEKGALRSCFSCGVYFTQAESRQKDCTPECGRRRRAREYWRKHPEKREQYYGSTGKKNNLGRTGKAKLSPQKD